MAVDSRPHGSRRTPARPTCRSCASRATRRTGPSGWRRSGSRPPKADASAIGRSRPTCPDSPFRRRGAAGQGAGRQSTRRESARAPDGSARATWLPRPAFTRPSSIAAGTVCPTVRSSCLRSGRQRMVSSVARNPPSSSAVMLPLQRISVTVRSVIGCSSSAVRRSPRSSSASSVGPAWQPCWACCSACAHLTGERWSRHTALSGTDDHHHTPSPSSV